MAPLIRAHENSLTLYVLGIGGSGSSGVLVRYNLMLKIRNRIGMRCCVAAQDLIKCGNLFDHATTDTV